MTQQADLLARLRGLRPSEARFVLDDALLLAWNLSARLRERSLGAEHQALLHKNELLRGVGRGKRCFILGNGPSLADHDLLRLQGEHVFVVNRFIHHPDAHRVAPRYYVVTDPKFGAGAWGEDFVGEVERRLPDTWMFNTLSGWEFLNRRGLLQAHRRFVIHPNQYFHFGYPFDVDLTRGIPGADNVTKAAIAIAAWMRFEEIHLLGIDGNGLLLSNDTHFYGHVPQPTEQVELERALVSASMSMRSWRALPDYLARRGIRLVSRNARSSLNALPYEAWLEGTAP
jgi:hypothetical protein